MKYILTDETKVHYGIILHRIECVTAFANVQAGEKGGWIEKESNLSQSGDAWIYGNAVVHGNAEVYGNAKVYGNAEVYGDAWIYGNAKVYGNAVVHGDAEISSTEEYMTIKNSWTSNRIFTYTHSNKKWNVGCFNGTGEELIKKAYKDSKLSGDCYKATVEYVEKIYKIIENESIHSKR